MNKHQKIEWEKLVYESVDNLNSACALGCDEAIVAMDKYKSSLEAQSAQQLNGIELLRELDEYLSINKFTNIGSGSILHRKIKDQLEEQG